MTVQIVGRAHLDAALAADGQQAALADVQARRRRPREVAVHRLQRPHVPHPHLRPRRSTFIFGRRCAPRTVRPVVSMMMCRIRFLGCKDSCQIGHRHDLGRREPRLIALSRQKSSYSAPGRRRRLSPSGCHQAPALTPAPAGAETQVLPQRLPQAAVQASFQSKHYRKRKHREAFRTRWHSRRTTGVVMLGVHMVTLPLACPRPSTPFQEFCAITPHGPSRVRCCATSCPVLVSCDQT